MGSRIKIISLSVSREHRKFKVSSCKRLWCPFLPVLLISVKNLTPYFSMASQFSLLSLLLSNIIEALVSIGLDFLKTSSNIPAFGFFLFLYYFCPTMITIPKEKKFIEERLIWALIFQRDLSPLCKIGLCIWS